MLVESLLTTKGINWSELSYGSNQEAIPVLRKGGVSYGYVVAERDKIRDLSPIGESKMAALMYKLQGHYWQPGLKEALAREVAADYVRLLGHYPLDVFQAAIDAWLMGSENKFFPKVGELNELLEAKLAVKKWRLKQLEKLIEKAE